MVALRFAGVAGSPAGAIWTRGAPRHQASTISWGLGTSSLRSGQGSAMLLHERPCAPHGLDCSDPQPDFVQTVLNPPRPEDSFIRSRQQRYWGQPLGALLTRIASASLCGPQSQVGEFSTRQRISGQVAGGAAAVRTGPLSRMQRRRWAAGALRPPKLCDDLLKRAAAQGRSASPLAFASHPRNFSSAAKSAGGGSGASTTVGRSAGRSRWVARVDGLLRRAQQRAEALAASFEDGLGSAARAANSPLVASAVSAAAAAAAELEGSGVVPEDAVHPDLREVRPCWNSRRCGLLAYKVGMMSLWDGWGQRHAVTVCQVDRCLVLENKTLERHGYEACVLGIGFRSPLRVSKPQLGRYLRLGVEPKAAVAEFKVSSDCMLPVGLELSVRHLVPGQWCFVTGWSKGRGFQGPVRRWGFKGQNASHGVESKAHRSHGSIGQSKTVNVVWKFKKMAGHMGPDPRVVNCQVLRIQADRNLVFLKGCVPGGVGSVVKIFDARGKTHYQRNRHISLPFPTFVPRSGEAYPLLQNAPDKKQDPFAYPEIPIYDKGEA